MHGPHVRNLGGLHSDIDIACAKESTKKTTNFIDGKLLDLCVISLEIPLQKMTLTSLNLHQNTPMSTLGLAADSYPPSSRSFSLGIPTYLISCPSPRCLMDDAARPQMARGANDRIPRHVSNSIKLYKFIGVSLNGGRSHTHTHIFTKVPSYQLVCNFFWAMSLTDRCSSAQSWLG